jgi:hypothetical protein
MPVLAHLYLPHMETGTTANHRAAAYLWYCYRSVSMLLLFHRVKAEEFIVLLAESGLPELALA